MSETEQRDRIISFLVFILIAGLILYKYFNVTQHQLLQKHLLMSPLQYFLLLILLLMSPFFGRCVIIILLLMSITSRTRFLLYS